MRRMRTAIAWLALAAVAAGTAQAAQIGVDFTTVRNEVRIKWGTNEKDFWRWVAGLDGANSRIIYNFQAVGNEVVRMWIEIGFNYSYPELDYFVDAIVQGGSTPMLCFVSKPSGYSDHDYYLWCLEVINRYAGMYDITGWYVQLINEPNLFGPGLSSYVTLYNYTAPRIKYHHPEVYVGGPGVAWFPTDWISTFLAQCTPADFLEWHRYGDWIDPSSVNDEYFMNRTPMFGDDVDHAQYYADLYGRDIDLHMGEYNVNSYWTPVDPRCTSIFNAAFTGSVLRHLIDSPNGNTTDMEMYWEDTGDAWGLWDNHWPNEQYPAFFTKYLFANYCHRGDEIATTSSSMPEHLEVLGLRHDEEHYRVFLIGKRNWTQYATVNITGPTIEGGTWYVIDQDSYDTTGISMTAAPAGNTQVTTLDGFSVAVLDALADVTITEASPPGWLHNGWNLVSVPVEPSDPEASAVFDDNVAAGNTLSGNLYSYSPGVGYGMYPGGFTAVEPGAGYWLYLSSATTESLTGEKIYDTFEIPLGSGWNLVGHPHEAAVTWAACSVSDGSTVKSVPDAEAAGWIDPAVYYYSGGAYASLRSDGTGDDDSLRPWYGYWLLANQADLTLIVPAP